MSEFASSRFVHAQAAEEEMAGEPAVKKQKKGESEESKVEDDPLESEEVLKALDELDKVQGELETVGI